MGCYCKYCDRLVACERMVTKKETHIKDNQKITYVWVGCVDCWERLQKVT